MSGGVNGGRSPIRYLIRKQRNTTVLLAEVESIDADACRVRLDDGEQIAYDALILAAGATHSYFGHDEWERHAPGLKTLDDAIEIRRRMLLAYEHAERADDEETARAWLTFVVIGGGPTGVEMAGTIAEVARLTMPDDFRRIDPRQARVLLLEGADRVLLPFVPELSEAARRQLRALGVEVRTGAKVTGIDANGVSVGDERIAARTLIWAAGVAASPLGRTLGVELDRSGRVRVGRDLSVPGHPEILVAGDLAAFEQDGRPVPGVAPAAIQMGRVAADNVLRRLRGEPTMAFHYIDKGSLATVGRKSGVADIRGLKLSGASAWLAWLFVHIYFLIGFRNRIVVLFEWAVAYFTYQRSARLILGTSGERTGGDEPAAQT